MLQLDVNQLRRALQLARRIQTLEGAKDSAESHELLLEETGIRVAVPAQLVREQIAKELAEASEELRALGVELLPGKDEGPRTAFNPLLGGQRNQGPLPIPVYAPGVNPDLARN